MSIAKSELPQKVQINVIDGKIRHEKLSRARRRYMLSLLRFIIAYTVRLSSVSQPRAAYGS